MISALLLAVSILASAVLYLAGLPFFFLFLFIPLIPFLRGRKDEKTCPVCGFRTTDPRIAFCPYDGTPLMGPASP
ncbi:MAG: hypothetical protein A4E38_01767 [Methanoregulaceae archaeon PtaB.Bin108]|nr:MAG: hypothetical protein A4E38_01767 [Methanoregulaceae archaeon PtaB.Bin108]OPY38165.1 MAG: hypothetical protein A4E40_01277 [Methanoregulaceae archaeon PtaU1.Bin059]